MVSYLTCNYYIISYQITSYDILSLLLTAQGTTQKKDGASTGEGEIPADHVDLENVDSTNILDFPGRK